MDPAFFPAFATGFIFIHHGIGTFGLNWKASCTRAQRLKREVKKSPIEDFYRARQDDEQIEWAAGLAGRPEERVDCPVVLVFDRINRGCFKTVIQYHVVATGLEPDDGEPMIGDTLDFDNLPCTFYPGFSTLL